MTIDRLHSLGDSWTCREGDTGLDYGWQVYSGILPDHRHGFSGTTAWQWATDEDGMLTRAMDTMQRGDKVIVSLVGNDIRHAAEDGKITAKEIYTATRSLYLVVRKIKGKGCAVELLVYCDPYRMRNLKAFIGVRIMEMLIRVVGWSCGCSYLETPEILTDDADFDGKDFHPSRHGHNKIATHIKRELET